MNNQPINLPDDVVLSVRGVSKKFCRNLRRSMWYGIQDLSRNLLGLHPKSASCEAERASCLVPGASCEELPATSQAPIHQALSTESPSTDFSGTMHQAPSTALPRTKHQAPTSPSDSGFKFHPSALLPPSQVSSLPSPDSGLKSHPSALRKDEFWALRDISFDVRRGEAVGIIGVNGSGKSTLFRVIHGLFPPDCGEVAIRGQVGALIALGAGFHPHMTGRENIYLNGAILGISQQFIRDNLEAIIEFADIRDFVDAPVSTYSSGMRVRLGFAIATQMNPDVMLVDEVLSVGDLAFREKSLNRMARLCGGGASVLFVSHSMSSVLTICQRVIWIDQGRVLMDGEAGSVVSAYIESQEKKAAEDMEKERTKAGEGHSETLYKQMRITGIELLNQNGVVTTAFRTGDDLRVRIRYVALALVSDPRFVIHVTTRRDTLLVADMLIENVAPPAVSGEGTVECYFRAIPLLPGQYVVQVFVLGKTQIIKIVFPPQEMCFRVVRDGGNDISAIAMTRDSGRVGVKHEWQW